MDKLEARPNEQATSALRILLDAATRGTEFQLDDLRASAGQLSVAQRLTLSLYARLSARIDSQLTECASCVVKCLGMGAADTWLDYVTSPSTGLELPRRYTDLMDDPGEMLIHYVTRCVTNAIQYGTKVPVRSVRLARIGDALYLHESDRDALRALKAIPGFATLTRKFIDVYSSEIAIQKMASNIQITQRSCPSLYNLFQDACEILDIQEPPLLYVEPGAPNAYTVGGNQHVVILTSGAASLLSQEELLYVLGHELGHVRCGHVVYSQMAQWISVVAEVAGDVTLGIGKLVVKNTIMPALYAWYRRSEFTADRAGLLTCQDLQVAISAQMKLAGYPPRFFHEIDTDAMLKQAREFDTVMNDSVWNRLSILISTRGETHPRTVYRVAELDRWTQQGYLHDLIDASPDERVDLCHSIEDDPLHDKLLRQVADGLASWTAEHFSRPARDEARAARRMLRFGVKSVSSGMDSVFNVDLEVSRPGADLVCFVVHALVMDAGKPKKISLKLPSMQWEQTPETLREMFLRENPEVLAFELYKAS